MIVQSPTVILKRNQQQKNIVNHHTVDGKELALYTANYIDEHIDEIEDKLDTGFEDKVQFIIFNNLTDIFYIARIEKVSL